MNILIVEDSIVEATLLMKELEKIMEEPVSVWHENTLEAGVEHLKGAGEKPDLVFLDLGLPDSAGWQQTYEAVSPFTSHLPVIVMTSNKNPEIIAELLEHGFQDFIVKGSHKQTSDFLRETVKFALLRHKVVDHLSRTVEERDQCVNWLSGGYSLK